MSSVVVALSIVAFAVGFWACVIWAASLGEPWACDLLDFFMDLHW